MLNGIVKQNKGNNQNTYADEIFTIIWLLKR